MLPWSRADPSHSIGGQGQVTGSATERCEEPGMQESRATPGPRGGEQFDLLLRDATLLDGTPLDLGIRGGVIVALQHGLRGAADQTLELGGRVVLPGLVEPHTHLDKSLTVSQAQNRSGTLREAIDLIGTLQ